MEIYPLPLFDAILNYAKKAKVTSVGGSRRVEDLS